MTDLIKEGLLGGSIGLVGLLQLFSDEYLKFGCVVLAVGLIAFRTYLKDKEQKEKLYK